MNAMAFVPSTPSAELYLPPLIAGAGHRAALRFLEFFTVNVRDKNTRAAYTRAAEDFLRWCGFPKNYLNDWTREPRYV